MMNRNWRIFFRWMLIVYLIGVALLCLLNLSNLGGMPQTIFGFPSDKVAHFLMYVPLPLLAYWGFYVKRGKPMRIVGFLLIIMTAGMVLGGGIELLQGLSGYRSCDILDFRADCLGLAVSVFGILLYSAFSRNW